jgi:uncharacterized protein YuzE
MHKLKFDYDRKYDNLFMHVAGAKSEESVVFGDLVLDFDRKKNIVGIEFTNASRFVSKITFSKDVAAVKALLSGLKECSMEMIQENALLIIRIHLVGRDSELSPIISLPQISETNPAIAYA